MGLINITGPAATQITGWHSITLLHDCIAFVAFYYTLFYCFLVCLLFIFSDFSLRATMLINLNLNLNHVLLQRHISPGLVPFRPTYRSKGRYRCFPKMLVGYIGMFTHTRCLVSSFISAPDRRVSSRQCDDYRHSVGYHTYWEGGQLESTDTISSFHLKRDRTLNPVIVSVSYFSPLRPLMLRKHVDYLIMIFGIS